MDPNDNNPQILTIIESAAATTASRAAQDRATATAIRSLQPILDRYFPHAKSSAKVRKLKAALADAYAAGVNAGQAG